MHKQDAQAIIMLLDNTATSINGDFSPTRLDAQKICVDRLVQYFLRNCDVSQIGIGTLGSDNYTIITSLTSRMDSILRSLQNISFTKNNYLRLTKGIGSALLALRTAAPQAKRHRIIAFLAENHDMTLNNLEYMIGITNAGNAAIDIIMLGDGVNNVDILENYISLIHQRSQLIRFEPGTNILADLVLASDIGISELDRSIGFDEDPEIALAMKISRDEYESELSDPELEEAKKQSLLAYEQEEDMDDEEISNMHDFQRFFAILPDHALNQVDVYKDEDNDVDEEEEEDSEEASQQAPLPSHKSDDEIYQLELGQSDLAQGYDDISMSTAKKLSKDKEKQDDDHK